MGSMKGPVYLGFATTVAVIVVIKADQSARHEPAPRSPWQEPAAEIPWQEAAVGRAWHVVEGPWRGEWVRRGATNVLDAHWEGPRGAQANDVLTVKKIAGDEVLIYRQGTHGYYRGTLSADRRTVRGRADWFTPGDTFTASIDP